MAYALEIDGLTKRFGDKTVVDDISFSVGEGEVFGFLGPNGSGKTTTIRIVLDILKPDAGVIRLLGGLTAREAMPRVGYLPEERGLLRKERFRISCGISGGSADFPNLRRWTAGLNCSTGSACTNTGTRKSRHCLGG